jgi:hypothetical protein
MIESKVVHPPECSGGPVTKQFIRQLEEYFSYRLNNPTKEDKQLVKQIKKESKQIHLEFEKYPNLYTNKNFSYETNIKRGKLLNDYFDLLEQNKNIWTDQEKEKVNKRFDSALKIIQDQESENAEPIPIQYGIMHSNCCVIKDQHD